MHRVRPVFHLSTRLSSSEVVERIGQGLRKSKSPVDGLAAPERIELQVLSGDVHLWSPQLIVDLSEEEEGCLLIGRFGPHPSIWTLYMAGYASCAFLSLLGFSFAFAQWTMEETPWALMTLPLSFLGAIGLYALALMGQKRGQDQMLLLKSFLTEEVSRHESMKPSP